MFLVIPPPTWKATGIRGKNSVIWPIAGSLLLLECKHYCEIGKKRKKMGKWPSTTAFNGNGMMAPHPLLHGFKSVIPREQIWGYNEKTSFEKAWFASSLVFDVPVRGNVSIVCGFLICGFEKNTKSFHEKVEYCALCWVKRVVVFFE